MAVFHLYRLKIERPMTLWRFLEEQDRKPGDIILSAVKEKPSFENSKGPVWRIGNIQDDGARQVFFALGKVTKAKQGIFDEAAGDFLNEAKEAALYTQVAIDLEYQVCAIAHESSVSGKVSTIAKNFEKMLNVSKEAERNDLKFTVNEIPDPKDFISQIERAYKIKSYKMTVSLPNPFDSEEMFQKPLQRLVQETEGKEGVVSIKGDSLNKGNIELLARSAASSGNTASAKIQATVNEKVFTKKLAGNPATLVVESEEQNSMDIIFSKLRGVYLNLRGRSEAE